MVGAAQSTGIWDATSQVNSPMEASITNESELTCPIAKEHQVLSQQPNWEDWLGLKLAECCDRVPIVPQKISHGSAWSDLCQLGVIQVGHRHGDWIDLVIELAISSSQNLIQKGLETFATVGL